PRALGNRSILCDPRRADMKDILNLKIKRRESFRPFAPSVLREAAAEWFDTDEDVPFMMQVHPVRAEKRSLIPAVTHVDGSGRLHTVTREANPRYHRLIDAFRALTGVPMLLNTSFNENEPVVCSPVEALDCFLRTRMDRLVMGNWVVRRGAAAP
ncbi:MAG TPA: carbamoyltransferase C-terminal domain-containing protein, partial [Burkholderiales bacterium]|nr:carbamoyltransferase C-terminal domain-containing protein [Burkholderiales bacterium]